MGMGKAFELGVLISAVDKVSPTLKNVAHSMTAAQKNIDQFTKAMKLMGRSDAEINKVSSALDRMNQKNKFAKMAQDLKKVGMARTEIDMLERSFNRLYETQKKIERVQGNIDKHKASMVQGASSTAYGVGSTIAAARTISSVVKPAMEFEDVMNNVKMAAFGKGLLDKSKANEIKTTLGDLTTGFEKLGIASKFSDTGVATGALSMLRGGLDKEFLLGAKGKNGKYDYSGLASAVYSAQLGDVELDTAGDFVAKMKAAYNLKPTKTLDAVNFFTKTSAASTMNYKDLIGGMLNSAGVSGQLGMTPEETALLVATTGTYTRNGEAAGTFTKDFLDRLMPKSKKQIGAMDEMHWLDKSGKSIFFDQGGKIKSLDYIHKMFQDAGKHHNPAELQHLFSTIFLEQGKNTALALATKSDVYSNIKGNVGNQLDMYQQTKIQMSGTKNTLDSLKETWNIVKRVFGEPLLKPLNDGIKKLNDYLGANVVAWGKAHQGLSKFIAGSVIGVTTLGTLAMAVKTASNAVKVMNGLKTLSTLNKEISGAGAASKKPLLSRIFGAGKEAPVKVVEAKPVSMPSSSLGKASNVLGKVGKVAGKAVLPLSIAMEGYNIYKAKDKLKATGQAIGGIGGGWAGAQAGAAIGTMIFPGVGTVIGGAVGGIGGYALGKWGAGKLVDASRGGAGSTAAKQNASTAQAQKSAQLLATNMNAMALALGKQNAQFASVMTTVNNSGKLLGTNLNAFSIMTGKTLVRFVGTMNSIDNAGRLTATNFNALAITVGYAASKIVAATSGITSNAQALSKALANAAANVTNNVNISVQAQPNHSTQDIANHVIKKLGTTTRQMTMNSGMRLNPGAQ